MNIRKWHSAKQRRWIDLTTLSREELISELQAQRKDGLVTEECMGNLLGKLEKIRDLADEELLSEK